MPSQTLSPTSLLILVIYNKSLWAKKVEQCWIASIKVYDELVVSRLYIAAIRTHSHCDQFGVTEQQKTNLVTYFNYSCLSLQRENGCCVFTLSNRMQTILGNELWNEQQSAFFNSFYAYVCVCIYVCMYLLIYINISTYIYIYGNAQFIHTSMTCDKSVVVWELFWASLNTKKKYIFVTQFFGNNPWGGTRGT